MGFVAFTLNLLFLTESYPPEILVSKASELRRRTKNWGIHAKQEEIEVDFRELLEKNFSRPIRMLFTERIVLLLSVYMAFIYGLLYLFLTAYPLVFQGVHGMNLGVGGLPFFGMITGQLLAGVAIFIRQPGYQKKLAANNNMPIPEWRLPEVIVGGICFSVGIFWFGWTGYKQDIHWIVPTLSGILIGFGLLSIFLQALNYLVDAYLMVRTAPFPLLKHEHNTNTNNSSPPLPLPQTPSSALSAALHSRSSPAKCSKAWASNGHLRSSASSPHYWSQCPCGSTSRAQRSGRRARLRQQRRSHKLRWRKAMGIKHRMF
jgi:hypothetical protein